MARMLSAMIRLSRTIRFCVNPPTARPPVGPGDSNGYGGVPSMRGLGRYYELVVTVAGKPEAATGYLMNIKAIDAATRSAALPIIERACDERPNAEPAEILHAVTMAVQHALRGMVESVRWRLTPTYSVEMEARDMGRVLIRQRFDFAASHRLHVDSMSDEANRATFGKCNNPNGHGHNYQLEPCVLVGIGGASLPPSLGEIESLVQRVLIDRFDHTHLNLDTQEFDAMRGGVNPSVERIAEVCFRLLKPEIARHFGGRHADLVSMTVWETDRTSATYEDRET